MGNPKGIHGELVQGDLIRLFRQLPSGGDRQHRFRVVPVSDRQFYQPLAHHRVGKPAQGAEADGAFHIGVFRDGVRLVGRQAGIEDVAGGTVAVLVIEQEGVLHGAAQQKDKGVKGGHQHSRQSKDHVFDRVEPEIPENQGPADL